MVLLNSSDQKQWTLPIFDVGLQHSSASRPMFFAMLQKLGRGGDTFIPDLFRTYSGLIHLSIVK